MMSSTRITYCVLCWHSAEEPAEQCIFERIYGLGMVEKMKSFGMSLYTFYQPTSNFDHEVKSTFLVSASLIDASRRLIGCVKGLNGESFYFFYPLIKLFYCARSALTERTFFLRVSAGKMFLLATYKKVDDNFKKGF